MNRLGVRLALAIGGSVAVVIVIAGLLVNAVLGSRFQQFLTQQQEESRAQAVSFIGDVYRDRGSLSLSQAEVRQVADLVGGGVAVYDTSGQLVGRTAGMGQPGGPLVDTTPIVVDGQNVGTLDVQVRGVAATVRRLASDAFRRAIDQTLLLAGLAAVVVAMVVAILAALGMTRPLAQMAAAARRLGAGDLSARVPVPSDAEGHEVAVAFNAMAESLERSEQLRRRAASDLAHEIATPVTVLSTQLDALADGVIPATAEHLAAARETAGEVARLVGDLHDLAAAEGASLHRSAERVDLTSLAQESAAAAMALFAQRGVSLSVVPTPGSPVLADVDPRQVGRVLQNLLTNAATFTPSGGSVTVGVARDERVARIRVGDTGPGIPPEHQARVFERFYRADPARRHARGQPGGTGIGLTVARELARANGGDVRIESTSPQGTTFAVDLPAAG